MAKKKKNSVDDDFFGVDETLDFEEFDFPDFDKPDDRKPITKVIVGAGEGVVDKFTDADHIKEVMKTALPKGYGETIDYADKVGESAKRVYDESAKAIKPAIKDAKKAATKLISPDSKLIPKFAQNKLQEWREELADEEKMRYASGNVQAQREAMLSQQTNEIFALNTQMHQKERSEDEGKERLQEAVDTKRHKDLFSLVNQAAMSVGRLDSYQNTITLNWQKKTLELQFRQLFASQDQLKFFEADSVRKEEIFRTLVKNTALPEFVKIKKSEIKEQLSNNRFQNTIYSGLFGGRDQFIEKTLKHISDMAVEKVKQAGQDIQSGLTQADGMADQVSGSGIDGYKLAGNIAGGSIVEKITSQLAGKARKAIDKSENPNVKKLKDFGMQAMDLKQNAFQRMSDFKNSDKYEYEDGIKAAGMRFLKALIPDTGADTAVDITRSEGLDTAAQWSKKTDRTLNEVIPGLLARILRENQMLRTGRDDLELSAFNYDRGEFTDEKTLDAINFAKVMPKNAARDTLDSLDKLVDMISGDNKNLPENVRKAMRQGLLTSFSRGKETKKENFEDDSLFKGHDEDTVSLSKSVLEQYFATRTMEDKLKFDKKSNELVENVRSPGLAIQEQINQGNLAQMRKTGFVKEDRDEFDMQKVLEHYLNQERDGVRVKKKKKRGLTDIFKDKLKEKIDLVPGFGTRDEKEDEDKEDEYEYEDEQKARLKKQIDKTKGFAEGGKVKKGEEVFVGEEGVEMFTPKEDGHITPHGEVKDQLKKTWKEKLLGKLSLEDIKKELVKRYAEFDKDAAVDKVKSKFNAVTSGINRENITGSIQKAKDAFEKNKPKSWDDAKEKTKSKVNELLSDIKMLGESNPRIQAIKMEAGMYRDKLTKKVIKSYNDIKNDVIDENGNVVIMRKDIPFLTIRNPKKQITETLTALQKGGKKFLESNTKGQDILNKLDGLSESYDKGIANVKKKVTDFVTDVYVGGENSPRLQGIKMQMGAYRDKLTDKIIEKYTDIKGQVLDENGKEVISEEQSKNLFFLNTRNQALEKLEVAKNSIQDLIKNPALLANKAKAVEFASNKFKQIDDAVAASLNPAADVFVVGRDEPALSKAKMMQGHYKDRITGKTITRPEDIDGDVIDENNQTVLNGDDLPNTRVYKVKSGAFRPIAFLGKKAWQFVRGMYNFQTGWAMRQTVRNFKALGMALRGAGMVGRGVKAVLGIGRMSARDVYVGDETTPRLYKEKLKRGEYSDYMTGKPIYHQDDIQGAVQDSEGTIVIPEDDLGSLKTFDSIFRIMNPIRLTGKAISMITKGVATAASWTVKKGAQASLWALKKLGTITGSVITKVLGLKPKPVDLFVKGTNRRVLLAADMQAGKYFSAKTGDPIENPTQIDGEVKDADGNSVLSEVDFETGLTDITGKSVKMSAMQKIGEGLGKLNKMLSVKRKLKVEVFDVKGAKKVLGDKNATPVDKTNAILVDFKEMVKKALTKEKVRGDSDGDGDRDNSVIDKMKNKAAELTNKKGTESGGKDKKEKKVDDKKGNTIIDLVKDTLTGWFTKAAMGALGLTGGLGLIKKIFGNGSGAAEAAKEAAKAAEATKAAAETAKTASEVGKVAGSAAGAARGASMMGKAAKLGGTVIGRVAAPIGGLADGYAEYTDDHNKDLTEGEKTTKAVGVGLGSAGGALAGGAVGATAGAAIGSAFFGIGAIPGALIGGALGIGGAYIGSKLGAKAGSAITEKMVDRAKLPSAGGPPADGTKAAQYIRTGSNVKLAGINPAFLNQFYGAVQEYGEQSGKAVRVTAGYRTYEDQVDMKKRFPAKAATPGNSSHEFGLAMDVEPEDLDAMEKMGLLRKYGLTRPVGGEPHHLEPAGIQSDIAGYKKNPGAASAAIVAAMGKGGGGIGSIPGTKLGSRDSVAAIALLNAPTGANVSGASGSAPSEIKKEDAKHTEGETVANAAIDKASKSSANIMKTSYTPGGEGPSPVEIAKDGEAPPKKNYMPTERNSFSATGGVSQMPDAPPDENMKVAEPKGAGLEGLRDTITSAARLVGVDPELMLKMAAIESGFNPGAKNPKSSASGLFQFTSDTWRAMITKYGQKYGLTMQNASPMDPKAASIMAALLLKENKSAVTRATTVNFGSTEAYMTHFLGSPDAKKFFGMMQENPNAIAATYLKDAAASNNDIFYSQGRARSFGEIYELMGSKVANKLGQFGMSGDKSSVTASKAPTDTQVSSPTATQPSNDKGPPKAQDSMATSPVKPGVIRTSYSPTGAAAQADSPILNSFGSQPNTKSAAQSPPADNMGLNKGFMDVTNEILKRSLDIQTETLQVNKDMLDWMRKMDKMASGQSSAPSAAAPTEKGKEQERGSYTPPRGVVSMKRTVL